MTTDFKYSHLLENCTLCPHKCGINRIKNYKGFCGAAGSTEISAIVPHYGEEPPISGNKGSGTVFFKHCNMKCVYCQNFQISQECGDLFPGNKDTLNLEDCMIKLQGMGCHNINLVTPTHVMPNILNATRIALKKGLHLPLMYNTSGYERLEILKMLEDVVDIYKPDMKYMDADKAAKYSAGASDYPEVTKKAIIEMHRQVGVLKLDHQGIAVRGVIIRHLVMPNRVAGTEKFVKWVAEAVPKSTYVNIMAQYRVEYKAYDYPEIARGITAQEFLEAMDWAEKYGLTNLDQQSVSLRNFYQHRRSS